MKWSLSRSKPTTCNCNFRSQQHYRDTVHQLSKSDQALTCQFCKIYGLAVSCIRLHSASQSRLTSPLNSCSDTEHNGLDGGQQRIQPEQKEYGEHFCICFTRHHISNPNACVLPCSYAYNSSSSNSRNSTLRHLPALDQTIQIVPRIV
jgi:hypothetical protein